MYEYFYHYVPFKKHRVRRFVKINNLEEFFAWKSKTIEKCSKTVQTTIKPRTLARETEFRSLCFSLYDWLKARYLCGYKVTKYDQATCRLKIVACKISTVITFTFSPSPITRKVARKPVFIRENLLSLSLSLSLSCVIQTNLNPASSACYISVLTILSNDCVFPMQSDPALYISIFNSTATTLL